MKRPSFQFYPDDWTGNSNLRRCSHEEKGIWIDILCVLHDQDEYGIVRWPLAELAQAAGTTKAKIKRLVEKGVLKGADHGDQCQPMVFVPRSGRKDGEPVTLIDQQAGPIWYSSRMVLDEYKRKVRGGTEATPKDTPDPSPKGGIGEGIDEAPKATPKDTPDPSPSRAGASSPSPSPLKTNTLSDKSDHAPPSDAVLVLNHLNLKTRRNYRPVAANIDLIAARLRDGVGVDECKSVIDAKVRQWGEDEKMREYLRPGTLFNRTKFEQYLGQLADNSPAEDIFEGAI